MPGGRYFRTDVFPLVLEIKTVRRQMPTKSLFQDLKGVSQLNNTYAMIDIRGLTSREV